MALYQLFYNSLYNLKCFETPFRVFNPETEFVSMNLFIQYWADFLFTVLPLKLKNMLNVKLEELKCRFSSSKCLQIMQLLSI